MLSVTDALPAEVCAHIESITAWNALGATLTYLCVHVVAYMRACTSAGIRQCRARIRRVSGEADSPLFAGCVICCCCCCCCCCSCRCCFVHATAVAAAAAAAVAAAVAVAVGF